jgi:hypothetical protein
LRGGARGRHTDGSDQDRRAARTELQQCNAIVRAELRLCLLDIERRQILLTALARDMALRIEKLVQLLIPYERGAAQTERNKQHREENADPLVNLEPDPAQLQGFRRSHDGLCDQQSAQRRRRLW